MFQIRETHDGVQTALMTLDLAEESGPFGNEHATSTQVLVVVCGALDARIDNTHLHLEAGDSVIVAKGAQHQFIGASVGPTLTVNMYTPPAYKSESEVPEKLRRDRSGEVYQNAFTENEGAPRVKIGQALDQSLQDG